MLQAYTQAVDLKVGHHFGEGQGQLTGERASFQQTSNPATNYFSHFRGWYQSFQHAEINVNCEVTVGNFDRAFYWRPD
jgi:hypothetical protein